MRGGQARSGHLLDALQFSASRSATLSAVGVVSAARNSRIRSTGVIPIGQAIAHVPSPAQVSIPSYWYSSCNRAKQRIVLRREMAANPPRSPMLARLQEEYQYDGIETCAGDGTCAMPVRSESTPVL